MPPVHEPPSHAAALWQAMAAVEQVPPAQVLLSQLAALWQMVVVPVEQVPAVAPVPLPHEPLSQSVPR